ncbi:MAG: hypothetical protein J7M25_12965 [Deltaproteobacteria bacterium]|nr:hypothetical protein [Deltaproteobacteria bacterium]
MLEITQIHGADESGKLNEDWFVVENHGKESVSLRNCQVGWSRPSARKYQIVAKLEPGFTLDSRSKIRVVSGNPRSKTTGVAPSDDIPNYFLFLKKAFLSRSGGMVRILRGQMTMVEAIYDPSSENGVAARSKEASADQ